MLPASYVLALFLFFLSAIDAAEFSNEKEIQKVKTIHDAITKLNQTSDSFSEIITGIKNKEIYDKEKSIDNAINELENRYRLLVTIAYGFPMANKDDIPKLRADVANECLDFRKGISEAIDVNHDFSSWIFMNIAPRGGYRSGISSGDIKEKEIREEYANEIKKNKRLSDERRVQSALREVQTDIDKVLETFLSTTFALEPRADKVLVKLLETGQYPEEGKVKIFKTLNIPYKGFREWRTTDGLFRTSAKFVTFDADSGEVTLEKEDGKRTTVERDALRKEDRDYVKERLSLKTTP